MTASAALQDSAIADTLVAALNIDGRKQPLPLSVFFARRKAQAWDCRDDGTVSFSFAGGIAGYLVEDGNVPNFSKPQAAGCVDVRQCSIIEIAIAFPSADLSRAGAAVFCFFCAEDGSITGRRRLSCESGKARDSLPVPYGSARLCFALRLAGEGRFALPFFRVTRKKTPRPAKTSPAQAEASALMRERRYHAAIRSLESMNGDPDGLLLMKCHSALHLFDETAALYETLSPRGRMNASARIHYLRALANLNRTAEAQRLIEEAVMDFRAGKGDIDFMASAYPFAAYLSPGLAQMVRGRILASSAHLKKAHLNQVLRCAHDLAGECAFGEFYRLRDAMAGMKLNRTEQARLHILSAQAFYVLGRHGSKLEAINKALAAFDLKPLALKNPGRGFDHANIFCCDAVPHAVRGPLVTVIMTTHNSAKTVGFALQSLMNQTYSDLEILVADDSSSDRTCEKILRLARNDPRITLIPLSRNSGTYVAKNHALAQARGAYVTCHDSDDWAHPQKVERLIAPLLAQPALIGAMAQHVRYHPKRGFRGRGGYIQPDAPSLTYRRKDVVDRIGFYDSARAGADTEHQYRIERTFGRNAIMALPDLLTLFLWSETSLTGGGVFAIDDDAGIFSKPRSLYRQAYMHWHESTPSHHIAFPLAERPFPIPSEMEP